MKTWAKTIICIALSFMFVFISVGYANLSDVLTLRGGAHYNVPDGLFIISVEPTNQQSRIDSENAFHQEYTTTVDCTVDKASSTASIMYEITVFNNTDRTYAYRDLYYSSSLSGYNGNSAISESSGRNNINIAVSFPNGSIVEPRSELVFYATYTFGRSMSSNTNWKTLVNYRFGINVNSLEEAREAVIQKFEDILNAPATYATLYDRIDDKFSGAEWTSNYIGNVTASTSEDSRTVNDLFAGFLQMTINGVDNPITVLIKHENVDNNQHTGDNYTAISGNQRFDGYGCEFTLYMTTSELESAGRRDTVYAAVFTCDQDPTDGSIGNWYLVGEPFEGTAQTVGYEGGNSSGSFDTGTWRSVAATYSPTENYSYTLENNQTIQAVTQAIDPAAAAALADYLTQAKAILDENIYAGTGMVALEDAYSKTRDVYTVADDGTIIVSDTATRVKLIPYLKLLESALKPFENIE